jgi:hypothetical protein
MDFKDLQKVWNAQTKEPMYVIDEQVLYRQIRRRARKVECLASVNEWGLMIISLLTSIALLWIGNDLTYRILAALTMLGTGIYVARQRYVRLRQLREQPTTIVEELDLALKNATYMVRFAQTFVYWFLLPTASVTVLRMAQREVAASHWLLILGSFVVAFLLARWELRAKHLPRKRALEELKHTLTHEIAPK